MISEEEQEEELHSDARSLACSIVFSRNASKESRLASGGLPGTCPTKEGSLTLIIHTSISVPSPLPSALTVRHFLSGIWSNTVFL